MHILVFNLININCSVPFDPTLCRHRKTMIYLEETIRHWYQKKRDISKLQYPSNDGIFGNLEVIFNSNHKLIIIDSSRRIAYKIHLLPKPKFKNGEDLAKNIRSRYICKIYDILSTSIFILSKKKFIHVKIIAMELLSGSFHSCLFYEELRDAYRSIEDYENDYEFYLDVIKPIVQKIMYHLIKGVLAFHNKNIGILDIKDANIMICDKKGKKSIKMIDFESAIPINKIKNNSVLCTLGSAAPEVLMRENITMKSDIWSIGILAYSLLTGNVFHIADKFDIEGFKEFCNNSSMFIEKITACKDLKCFLTACLQFVPEKRPTAAQLLDFKFIKDYYENQKYNDDGK
ncbi:putative myosin light chain kinase 3 [Conglomerata obtusa]